MKRLLSSLLVVAFSLALSAESTPVLRMPGQQDRPIAPATLLGSDRSEVKVEDGKGGTTLYAGSPLLAVLEKNGLETKDMGAEERRRRRSSSRRRETDIRSSSRSASC